MNTLFLENKKDAIKFAKQINEAFLNFGYDSAKEIAFNYKFRTFRTQEVFDAFEKEFDKKTPEMKKIFLQLARDCEFFDENLYK